MNIGRGGEGVGEVGVIFGRLFIYIIVIIIFDQGNNGNYYYYCYIIITSCYIIIASPLVINLYCNNYIILITNL